MRRVATCPVFTSSTMDTGPSIQRNGSDDGHRQELNPETIGSAVLPRSASQVSGPSTLKLHLDLQSRRKVTHAQLVPKWLISSAASPAGDADLCRRVASWGSKYTHRSRWVWADPSPQGKMSLPLWVMRENPPHEGTDGSYLRGFRSAAAELPPQYKHLVIYRDMPSKGVLASRFFRTVPVGSKILPCHIAPLQTALPLSSSSNATATSALAERRIVSPSTSATKLRSR